MSAANSRKRRRARELGLSPGILEPGPLNAITDVAGVRVGHVTLIEGASIRTGVTAILPHGGNLFQEKVRAGLAVGNGFGKLAGATQITELGVLETPVILTNTLAVGTAVNALVSWTLDHPDNEDVTSVNAVAGETHDGRLNDIRARAVTDAHVLEAIRAARGGAVAEGCVGAGTGTMAFGLKAGIGTASRRLSAHKSGFTVGVLVQANFGGVLMMDGLRVAEALGLPIPGGLDNGPQAEGQSEGGSCMIVLATDAPVLERNLTRMARRCFLGLARTGAILANGSGDYALAFSTRNPVCRGSTAQTVEEWPNERMDPLFLAAVEATEEAVLNALCMATEMTGYRGRHAGVLDLEWLQRFVPERRK
ncbi:MAG: P1 family peptidase [Alphaproteobacteria bacterium]